MAGGELASMLTLDTSGLVALINPDDRYHADCVALFGAERDLPIIPMPIMAEIAYILEARGGHRLLLDLLADLEARAYAIDCGDHDFGRIESLIRRYDDLRLGFADAAVVACAERHDGRVMTIDRRHFPVVARGEGTIVVLPEIVG